MDSPFFDEIRTAFQQLIQKGMLKIVSSSYDAEAFGNATVVLEGKTFLVRLVKDRGDMLADVCSSSVSEEWRPLERMLHAVGVAEAQAEGMLSPAEAAKLVQEHFEALEAGLSPEGYERTRQALQQLDAEAHKRMEERWARSR